MLLACNQQMDKKADHRIFDNDRARLGYALGVLTDIDAIEEVHENRAALVAGIYDGLSGVKSRLGKEDAAKAAKEIARIKKEKALADFKKLQAKNKIEGDAFLHEHAKKKGVQVTASGLQYEVLKQGEGEKPGPSDKVTVLYSGKLMDGTVFNPYHKPEEPASFTLDNVIKGWAEGVQLMSVGSKYRFVLPPALAFGESGAGANIPPNAVMVFEIELLDIKKDMAVIKKSGDYTLEIER